jgi:hypothetical protein
VFPCQHCGYDLTGLPAQEREVLCPECGRRTPTDHRPGTLGRVWLVAVIGTVVSLVVIAEFAGRLGERGRFLLPVTLLVVRVAAFNGMVAAGFAKQRQRRVGRPELEIGVAVALVTGLLGWPLGFLAGLLGSYANV